MTSEHELRGRCEKVFLSVGVGLHGLLPKFPRIAADHRHCRWTRIPCSHLARRRGCSILLPVPGVPQQPQLIGDFSPELPLRVARLGSANSYIADERCPDGRNGQGKRWPSDFDHSTWHSARGSCRPMVGGKRECPAVATICCRSGSQGSRLGRGKSGRDRPRSGTTSESTKATASWLRTRYVGPRKTCPSWFTVGAVLEKKRMEDAIVKIIPCSSASAMKA